jgi:diguanylate cyclase (GGDEF)-like protein
MFTKPDYPRRMFISPAQSAAMALHPQLHLSPWTAARARMQREAQAALILGLAVFAAGTIGLATAHAFSVSFWPANAVIVGLVLRNRGLICPSGWLGIMAGFVIADLLFGRPLSLALWFAATNLIGTMVAAAFLLPLDQRDLRLLRVHSMLRILVRLLPGCMAAGLCGALLVMVEFHGRPLQALMTWPASELVNYLVVLPAMLTLFRRDAKPRPRVRGFDAAQLGPLLFLAVSCAAAVAFDGPGSIMFPLPALLLCALTYSLPTTALLTLVLGTGCLIAIGMGAVDIGQDLSIPQMVISLRIAVAFLVLVPLTISSVVAVRDELLAQLRQAADHDGLTGLLNRRAFEQRMRDRLEAASAVGRGLAILWLDIDHFKAINDRHGHLAGDAVLQAFAATARACCRQGDLVGRMGGEEFALVLEVTGAKGAAAVAERLRRAFADQTVLWNGMPIRATVSIGACHLDRPERADPDLVNRLDEALYRAKRKGRDRVEWLDDPVPAGASLHAAH